MNATKLSICIATYNIENYISECLDSIYKYVDFPEFEIIVVDDCSTDNTRDVVKKWMLNHPDVAVVFKKNNKNSWPWPTYNNAIKLAKWEFITFIDWDDFLIKNTFKNKLDLFKKNENLKVVYWNWIFYEKKTFWLEVQPKLEKLYWESIDKTLQLMYTTIPVLIVRKTVLRRSFIEKIWWFDEKINSNDRILNIKIWNNLKYIDEVKFDKDPCFGYRIHDNNISKDQKRMLKLLSEVIEKYHPDKYKKIAYSNAYFFVSLNLILQNKRRESFSYFKQSIKFRKSIKRLFIYLLAIITPRKLIQKLPYNFTTKIKKFIQKYFQ